MIEGYLLNRYNIGALNIANLISKFGICIHQVINEQLLNKIIMIIKILMESLIHLTTLCVCILSTCI